MPWSLWRWLDLYQILPYDKVLHRPTVKNDRAVYGRFAKKYEQHNGLSLSSLEWSRVTRLSNQCPAVDSRRARLGPKIYERIRSLHGSALIWRRLVAPERKYKQMLLTSGPPNGVAKWNAAVQFDDPRLHRSRDILLKVGWRKFQFYTCRDFSPDRK